MLGIVAQQSLDFYPAIFILFSIAFGPAYLAVNLLQTNSSVNAVMVCIVLFLFLCNALSITMLNSSYKANKLGSFQEMAYNTSHGNRGYIFLISAMKVAYLCMTSAYCLSFIA